MLTANALRSYAVCLLMIAVGGLGNVRTLAAQDLPVTPYLDDQTMVVLRIRPADLNAERHLSALNKLAPDLGAQAAAATAAITMAQGLLTRAGIQEVYVVVSFADSLHDIPFVIATYDHNSVNLVAMQQATDAFVRSGWTMAELDKVLFFGKRAALERLQRARPQPRPDVAQAFEAAGDAAVQFVFAPNDDHRRAAEEMVPQLPDWLGGAPSQVLTRGGQWVTLAVDTSNQLSVHVTVQSRDEQAARDLQQFLSKTFESVTARPAVQERAPGLSSVAPALVPNVQGDRLVLTLDDQFPAIDALMTAIAGPLDAARSRAQRVSATNHLKQMGLAMHNHYDVHKRFPLAGSHQGRAMLSWRVHLLPYLEHQALYDQFHLDEPWDSPHNRTLIDEMPPVFLAPGSSLKPSQGKSTFALPHIEGSIFAADQPLEFRDIQDGTSNTILIVEVQDKDAQEWTKPEALVMDPENLTARLGGHYEDVFLATFADGSVHALPVTLDPEVLKAIFTAAGGEVVNRTW